MGRLSLRLLLLLCAVLCVCLVEAEDAYKYYTWTVTYGTRSPLGIPQQVGHLSTFLILLCIHLANQGIDLNAFLTFCFVFSSFWKVILINGEFPGPRLDVVTNDNIILNLVNKLDEPFLLTW